MQVADFAGDEPHVADLLGLYYLDSLDPSEGRRIEHHLQSCAACRAAADETCEAIAALALLGDERDKLLDDYGALNRTGGAPPAQFARFFGQDREGHSGLAAGRLAGPASPPPGLGSQILPPRGPGSARPESDEPVDPGPAAPAGSKPAAPGGSAWKQPSGPDWSRPDGTISDGPLEPLPANLVGKLAGLPATGKPAPSATGKPANAFGPVSKGRPVDLPRNDSPPKARVSGVKSNAREDAPSGPSARRRPRLTRRTRGLVGAGGLLVVALAVGGLATGALLNGSDQAPAESKVVTAAATAADGTTGASVSVFVTEQQDGSVNVRATVNGLRAGAGYRLRAVLTDGRILPVVNWTGSGSVQDVTGIVQARLAQLSFFTVTRPDNSAVVSVYLPQASAPAAASTS